MLSPSSRLGDDLFALYSAVLGWFLLPFYGGVLADILPSDWHDVDRAFDLAVPVMLALGAWSGIRGGPMMVSRAAVLYELGSPMSRRRLLLPWLVRQAVAWAVASAIAATIVLATADKDGFDYGSAAAISVAAALGTASAVFVAVVWMVATRGDGQPRALIVTGSAMMLGPLVAALAGLHFTSTIGVVGLVGLCAITVVVAIIALQWAPIDSLWRRASAIEAMRSSMQQVDFQRVLLDLRHAADRPVESPGTGPRVRRLPTPVWRYVAAIHHTRYWHLARVGAVGAAAAGLFWAADPRDGVVTLAIAVCGLVLGLELVGTLAATADHLTFIVHYPKRSDSILRAQLATSVGIAMTVGFLVVGGRIASAPGVVAGATLLFGAGALGAAVQARLGSPDVAALSDKYGFMSVPKILWGRALLGPGILFAVTVAVFHQFMRPEIVAPAYSAAALAVVLTAGFVISTSPLERAIR